MVRVLFIPNERWCPPRYLVCHVTMRAMAIGGPIEANLVKSLIWLAAIFAVFVPLAIRAYRRAS
jgi:hypothetical protein